MASSGPRMAFNALTTLPHDIQGNGGPKVFYDVLCQTACISTHMKLILFWVCVFVFCGLLLEMCVLFFSFWGGWGSSKTRSVFCQIAILSISQQLLGKDHRIWRQPIPDNSPPSQFSSGFRWPENLLDRYWLWLSITKRLYLQHSVFFAVFRCHATATNTL